MNEGAAVVVYEPTEWGDWHAELTGGIFDGYCLVFVTRDDAERWCRDHGYALPDNTEGP